MLIFSASKSPLKTGESSMKDYLTAKNVMINGHRTSLRLESVLWDTAADICKSEGLTVNELFSLIDNRRGDVSRTSAIRAFIVTYLHALATEKGSLKKQNVSSTFSKLVARS